MKKLIVANWKMNPEHQQDAQALFEQIKKGVADVRGVEVVVCPPFVYLPLLKGLVLGAQNVFYHEHGAYTGEVSPLMLKDLGVEYVIVGHSEARRDLGETDETVNRKVREVLAAGLTPIMCVGEKGGEDRQEVIMRQVGEGLKDIFTPEDLQKLVIAYEPIWAIGTGKNCPAKEAADAATLIRRTAEIGRAAGAAQHTRVLYGGSANAKNAAEYLVHPEMSGLLVGGASLNAEAFSAMVRQAAV